jgi:uncharacterized protein YjbI with pentapeptide repeats
MNFHSYLERDLMHALTCSSLLLLALGNTAWSAGYTYDVTRRDCINGSGATGRNAEWGICSDQSGKDLSGSHHSAENVTGSDFSFASLSRSNFDAAILDYSILNSASFDAASLERAKLNGIKGEAANFESSRLQEATFRGSDLNTASFANAQADLVDFTQARLNNAVFQQAQITEAKFRSAALSKANFNQARSSAADFSNAQAPGSDFRNADLSLAIFRGADISRTNMFKANIDLADFRNAVVKGADLRAENFASADWRGAKFDASTVLPIARDEAVRIGMIFDSELPWSTTVGAEYGASIGNHGGLRVKLSGSESPQPVITVTQSGMSSTDTYTYNLATEELSFESKPSPSPKKTLTPASPEYIEYLSILKKKMAFVLLPESYLRGDMSPPINSNKNFALVPVLQLLDRSLARQGYNVKDCALYASFDDLSLPSKSFPLGGYADLQEWNKKASAVWVSKGTMAVLLKEKNFDQGGSPYVQVYENSSVASRVLGNGTLIDLRSLNLAQNFSSFVCYQR